MRNKLLKTVLCLGLFLGALTPMANIKANEVEAPEAYGPTPTQSQLEYSKEELAAFIHFGVNTFTDREWGDGTEDPAIFNPTELDPDQWVRVLSEAGFKKVIITAKHHDGFALFDSPGTEHDIANEAINENVRGRDIVKEVADACHKYGVKFGVYLSPWDQNSPNYGNDRGSDYNEYYMNQIRYLLDKDRYGEVSEVWFDGAKGSGVAQDYYFDQWFNLVRELQPNALIFSDMGWDVRWIGNEGGVAGEPCWSRINRSELTLPEYDTGKLNHGQEFGTDWVMPEADTSIRPGWFFHQSQSAKSLNQLVDIYFSSVGRNATLLLNVPPNKEGLIEEADVARLNEFHEVIENTFKDNMALNAEAKATNVRGASEKFGANNVTDGDYDTYWTTNDGVNTGSIEIDLGEETIFDVISIQEYIPLGQRINSFTVDVYSENTGSWAEVYAGQTIGYKRLVRLAPTSGSKIRINIKGSNAVPLINEVGVYKADSAIELESNAPLGLKVIDDQSNQISYEGNWDNRLSQSDFLNNTSHWSGTTGAKATLTFTGSKFYFVTAKDPNHGIFNVSIDGGEPFEVDCYGTNGFEPQQIVYESDLLEYGEHTVTLTLAGKNNHGGGTSGHIDGFYVLDNPKGLVQMKEAEVTVNENDGRVIIPLERVGGTQGEVTVTFSLESGSALQDKDFQRMIEDVTFKDGQSEAQTSVVIFDNEDADGLRDFKVRISKVIGGATGSQTNTIVHIKDDDSPENLAYKKDVQVSSVEDNLSQFNGSTITDGDRGSRWSSEYSDDQWVIIDLGEVKEFDEVDISWENAFASQYKILVSEDGNTYTEVVAETNGAAGWKKYAFEPVNARYVKVQMEKRATRFGYSIYEVEVYKVSKAKLSAAVEKANDIDQTLYTDDSLLAFVSALENAEEVIDSIVIQDVVNESLQALNEAVDQLVFKNADYSKVDAAIAKAEALNKDNYTDFTNVEAAIEAVVEGLDITKQAEVDAMAQAIEDAIAGLTLKGADYTAVDEAIAKAEALDPEDYKDFSAVEAAIDAVVRGKDITEQDKVDAMAKAIEDAIAALEEKDSEPVEPEEADKSALEKAIDDAKAINTSKYTEESVAKLDQALADAEKVFANKEATQAEVNAATAKLNSAIKGLVEKTTDPEEPVDPEDPTDPTEPTDPEDPTEPTDPEKPTEPETPSTNDTMNIMVLAVIMVISGCAFILLTKRKKEVNE